MRKLLALLVVLALLALGLWFFVGHESAESVVIDGVRSSEKVASTQSGPAQLERQATESARKSAERTAASAPRSDAPAASAANEHLAEIKGRCLLPSGSPAADVAIRVHGWAANEERVIRHGEPEHWEDPETTTGADGRFSIRFDPPLAYQFVLNAEAPGYAKASWRWNEIKRDETKDVGDIQLLRGGAIVGRIVDAKGTTQKDGWTVNAESAMSDASERRRGGGRDATRKFAPVDPRTGEFRIEDMPPGTTKLSAQSSISGWVDGPTVDVRAGEVVEAQIRYEGPDNGARIVVTTHSRPFHVYAHDFREILLRGPGIEPRRAANVAGSSQSFSFDDLPPGRYSVEINDTKFLPWRRDNIAPGTSVDAELKGSAGVRLEIVDAKTGEAVVPSMIRVRFDKANFLPNEFRLLDRDAKLPKGGRFDGLIPVDQTLIVSAVGYADCEVPALDLNPNESRALRAAMTRGSRIAGRVVVGDARAPGANAEVVLEDAGAEDSQSQVGAQMQRISTDLQQASHLVTDASGRFEFTMVSPGKHRVRASYSAQLSSTIEVDVGDGGDKLDLVLALPACSVLVGRLIAPEGASFAGLSLLAMPVDTNAPDDAVGMRWSAREMNAISIGADGSFRTGPLALGEAQIALRLAGVMLPSGFNSARGGQPVQLDLGRVTITAGPETQHDFDVRSIFPGHIEVTLRVNGAPAPGTVVEVRNAENLRRIEGGVLSDANEKSASNPLACRSYRLLARAVDHAWFYLAPETVTVKAGEIASASIDVALADGVLQMLDDNKMPARVVKSVSIRLDGENPLQPVAEARLSTNSDGRIDLRLPPGSYRLFPGEGIINRDTNSVAFDMTPTGPVPAELEFPR